MEQNKIDAIVSMAKKGTVNERKTAVRILKKICKKYDLIFDELMEEEKEYRFRYSGVVSQKLAFQIFFKIINSPNVSYNSDFLIFKTTPEKFLDLGNAFDIYKKLFTKEKLKLKKRHAQENKLFTDAFIQRHDIFGVVSDEKKKRKEKAKKITKKEIEDIKVAMRMAGEMDEDANIFKQIGGDKNESN